MLYKTNYLNMVSLILICLATSYNIIAEQLNRNVIHLNDSIPVIERKNQSYDRTDVYISPSNATWLVNIDESHFRDSSILFLNKTTYTGEERSRLSLRKSQFDNSQFVIENVDMIGYGVDAYGSNFYRSRVSLRNLSLRNFDSDSLGRYHRGELGFSSSNFTDSRINIHDIKLFSSLNFNRSKMRRTTTSIFTSKINGDIRFTSLEMSDSSKISISGCSLGLNGSISINNTITKNSLVEFSFIRASNNGKINLVRTTITDGSVLLFENCTFIENSRITMDRSYLAKNARLVFKNNNINGEGLDFYEARLHGKTVFHRTFFPEYVDFRYVEIGDYEVDFSWVKPASEGQKIKIALWGSDIEKIRLNTHFEIWFPEEGLGRADLTIDDKRLVFSRLLAKYKSENNDYLFEYFEKESQRLSCEESLLPCPRAAPQTGNGGIFTDERDNKTYHTVRIGNLTWMAENLNFQADASWYYKDDNADCARYGRLYTWDAAITACPPGWRLPTDEDWKDLINIAGGDDIAGAKLKSKSPDWDGTDDFGFSALPGGFRSYGKFNNVGMESNWWCWWYGGTTSAFYQLVDSGKINMYVSRFYGNENYGFSVRCVKDVRQ